MSGSVSISGSPAAMCASTGRLSPLLGPINVVTLLVWALTFNA